MIIFAMIAAFFVWYMCMRQLGTLLKKWDKIEGEEWKIYRVFFCVFVYSLAVIEYNKILKKIATKIVIAENHKFKKDYEESMI